MMSPVMSSASILGLDKGGLLFFQEDERPFGMERILVGQFFELHLAYKSLDRDCPFRELPKQQCQVIVRNWPYDQVEPAVNVGVFLRGFQFRRVSICDDELGPFYAGAIEVTDVQGVQLIRRIVEILVRAALG